MQIWRVKGSGVFEKLAVFVIGFIPAAFVAILYFHGVSLFSLLIDPIAAIFILGYTSIFWLPAIIVSIKRIIVRKVPKEIRLDDENQKCEIVFSPKKIEQIGFDQIAYSTLRSGTGYFELTFYKTFKGTRGQTVYIKVTELIGLRRTSSWKREHLEELTSQLEKLELEQTNPRYGPMPLWERLITA